MMKRRNFIRNSVLAGAAGFSGMAPVFSGSMGKKEATEPFNMKFSPDFGLFRAAAGEDLVDQIKWAHDHGFRAWESTFIRRREVAEQERVSREIQRLGMEFGQFVGTHTFSEVTFAGRDEALREKVMEDIRASVETAKRLNTKYIHNVLGIYDMKLDWDFQLANAIELLKRIAEVYEKHDLIMVMETMNHKINHPEMFLHTIGQAYAMCKAVNSPSVKILFDIYHVQIQEGNLIPTIDYAWDEIAYFQVGDTPGRKEPGTGEINYKVLLQHIWDKGYRGFLGLEHGAKNPGAEGAMAVVEAYRSVDPR